MSDILLAEYTLKRALREHTMDLIQTSSPHLFCTPLPKHWRSNKSLPNQFRVVSLIAIPDGTRVSVTAGNEDRPFAELKNPVTVMHGNEARFSDLRFLGRSGRGEFLYCTLLMRIYTLAVITGWLILLVISLLIRKLWAITPRRKDIAISGHENRRCSACRMSWVSEVLINVLLWCLYQKQSNF